MKTVLVFLAVSFLATASTFIETATCSVTGLSGSSGPGNCSVDGALGSAGAGTSLSFYPSGYGIGLSLQQSSAAAWESSTGGGAMASASLQLDENITSDGLVRPGILEIRGDADTAEGDTFGGASLQARIGPAEVVSFGNGSCMAIGPGTIFACSEEVQIDLGGPLSFSLQVGTSAESCGPCGGSAAIAILDLSITAFEADGTTPVPLSAELFITPEPGTAPYLLLGVIVSGVLRWRRTISIGSR